MLPNPQNQKLTSLQKMRMAIQGKPAKQESELDREIRTLQLQKQRKDGLIDFFAIDIFLDQKNGITQKLWKKILERHWEIYIGHQK